jgi:multidrug efflux pump subunit AcrA (membrane-fusion protein)
MITQPAPIVTNGTRTPRPPRRAWWRQRRVLFAVLAVLLIVVVLTAVALPRSAPPPAPPPAAAALIAHGQIVPARQARVGTQGGGVVQELSVSVGTEVTAQTPIARVSGAGGTVEIVTAPFNGSVTNILVHTGDTLLPGATIAIVADLHTLQVETNDVDEFLLTSVNVGQRVQVSVDALDNRALVGTVTSVALLPQTAANGGQAYPVTISLGSIPAEVRPGMSVRITFPQ